MEAKLSLEDITFTAVNCNSTKPSYSAACLSLLKLKPKSKQHKRSMGKRVRRLSNKLKSLLLSYSLYSCRLTKHAYLIILVPTLRQRKHTPEYWVWLGFIKKGLCLLTGPEDVFQ